MDGSHGKTISEYNLKRGGWSKTPNFGCFFIWSIQCLETTDFVQLIEQGCQMRLRTHSDIITQIRVKAESVWYIVT